MRALELGVVLRRWRCTPFEYESSEDEDDVDDDGDDGSKGSDSDSDSDDDSGDDASAQTGKQPLPPPQFQTINEPMAVLSPRDARAAAKSAQVRFCFQCATE